MKDVSNVISAGTFEEFKPKLTVLGLSMIKDFNTVMEGSEKEYTATLNKYE